MMLNETYTKNIQPVSYTHLDVYKRQVGRCADYALHDFKNCINLFIYGDEETKVKRIMSKYSLTEDKAKDMIVKKDKQRQSYYNYYSSKKWGRADSYDFCLNSSVLGVEGTVKLIIQIIEDFENQNNPGAKA